MLVIVLFWLAIAQGDCREKYINIILESRDDNRYFLVIKASIDNKETEIIVTNNRLYNFLKSRNKKFSDDSYYKEQLKKQLKNQIPLLVGKAGLRKMKALYVKYDTAIISQASKGKEYFINKFFDVSPYKTYAKLKYDVADEKISQILKILFEWNYLVGIIEGNFTIVNMNLCEDK